MQSRSLRSFVLLLPLALLLREAPVRGDEPALGPEVASVWVNAYDEKMNQTLDAAEKAAAKKDWRKATELFQQAADRATNQVRRVGRREYLGIREFVKSRILSWPPAGLAAYRGVIDSRAEALYERGMKQGRALDLAEVARRYPLSSIGARAMLDLATRDLVRGNSGGALRMLTEILRLYPRGEIPGVSRADVLLIAAAAGAKRGDRMLVKEMAARAARLPAGTRVRVGGVEKDLGKAIAELPLSPAGSQAPRGFSTIGGGPSRSGGRSGPKGPLVPYFSIPIPGSIPPFDTDTSSGAAPLFPVLPLLTGKEVVVGGRTLVTAYPLPRPGRIPGPAAEAPIWNYPGPAAPEGLPNSEVGEAPAFLTRRGDLLTFPFPDTSDAGPDQTGARTTLVTLSLRKLQGARLDQVPDMKDESYRGVRFCGAPAIVGDRLWITGRRGGEKIETLCFGFDLSTGSGLLRRLFATSVCLGHVGQENQPSWPNGDGPGFEGDASSVAVRNGIVYFCSNTGAVAALDGETGEVIWLYAYQRTTDAAGVYPRDTENPRTWYPNPPIVDDQFLYVAPVDSDRLLVFSEMPELEHGHVLRSRFDRGDVSLGFSPRYLLGARDGVVYVAGDTRALGERPLFAVKTWPAWLAGPNRPGDQRRILWRADVEEDSPCGRGAVAGDYLYFPTKKGIYRVSVKDGSATRIVDPSSAEVRAIAGKDPVIGNLAVAGPWLVSATDTRVTLFGPPVDRAGKEKPKTGH